MSAGSLDAYVSSLHAQAAESSRKLKEIYNEMKQPPSEMQTLVYESEGLRLMLGDLVAALTQNRTASPSMKTTVLESLRSCQPAIQSIKTLMRHLGPLANRTSKQRAFGSRVDREKIEDVEKQVHQAKSTVLLAKLAYDSEIQRLLLSKILTAIPHLARLSQLDVPTGSDQESTTPVNSTSMKQNTRREPQNGIEGAKAVIKLPRPDWHTQKAYRSLGGLLDIISSNSDSAMSATFSVNPPSWFHARRYNIYLSKSYQGWDTNLRVYRTVDFDAPIFHCSMAGDVDGLEQLFRDGTATPFDIDPEGRTALHYAAMYARPDACRLLLREGADSNARTSWQGKFAEVDVSLGDKWYPDYQEHVQKFAMKAEVWRGRAAYSTPLHMLSSVGGYLTYGGREELTWTHYESHRDVTEDIHETIDVLTTKGDTDTLLEDQFGFTPFHLFTGRTDSFAWLRRFEQVMLHNLSAEETWNILWSRMKNFGSMTNNSKVNQIREGIPGEKVPKHLTRNFPQSSALSSSGSFLSMTVKEWIESREILIDDFDEAWESLMLEFLEHDADLHVIATDEGVNHTILMRLIFASLLPPKIDMSLVLRKWLKVLIKAGIDLEEYGREELDLHNSGNSSWEVLIDMGTMWMSLGYCRMVVSSFQIGQNPQDWNVEWDLVDWDIAKPERYRNEAPSQEAEASGRLEESVRDDDDDDDDDNDSELDRMASMPGGWTD